MDSAPLSEGVLRVTLADLARLNRYFGGYRIVIRQFERWSMRWPAGASVSVLDVGAGGGDVLLALEAWARSRGYDLRITGIDSTPVIVTLAREKIAGRPRLEIIQADLFDFAR